MRHVRPPSVEFRRDRESCARPCALSLRPRLEAAAQGKVAGHALRIGVAVASALEGHHLFDGRARSGGGMTISLDRLPLGAMQRGAQAEADLLVRRIELDDLELVLAPDLQRRAA